MDKTCAICGEVKQALVDSPKDSDFSKDSSRKDGFQNKCRPCQKKLSGKHYQNNKPDYLARSQTTRRVLQGEVSALKEASPCTDCGKFYPHYVMDYDHLGEIAKVDNVSSLIRNTASRPLVMAEIAKCELVCSNCHRIRTHERILARGLDELAVEVVA